MASSFDQLLQRLDHLSAQFNDLREGIRQAVTIAELAPAMSLTLARKVLEHVVRQVYEQRLNEPAGTRPLENLLQRLTKDGLLPRRVAAYANAVRELGNVGTHAFGEQVTPQDVLQSLTQLLEIVEWYFEQAGAAAPPPTPTPAAPEAAAAPPPSPGMPRPAKPFRNSLGNQLLPIPAEDTSGGQPSKWFACATLVSNADYLAFVRAGGPEPRGSPTHPTRRTWQARGCPDALLDHPVLYVAHADAVQFCDWLTEKEQREGRVGRGQRYHLPTLPQWQALARGERLPRDAVTDKDWRPGELQPTAPVSWGEPSALGLYHLFGNVFEWCADVRDKDGQVHSLTIGGGFASSRRWLENEIRQGTLGAIWRRRGLPMKDGGFRICLS